MQHSRSLFFGALTIILTLSACESAKTQANAATDIETSEVKMEESNKVDLGSDIEKGSYLIGYNQVRQIIEQTAGVVDAQAFGSGVRDAIAEVDPAVPEAEMQQYFAAIQAAIAEQQQAASAEADGEAKAFRDAFAAEDGVTTLPSGLMYQVITAGEGEKPTAEDTVVTHYHGTLMSGEVFDSSVDRGEPATFPVNGVIKGWTEALQLMPVGSKWKLVIPSDLAYGERGAGGAIGPNATLVFEVELLEIQASE